MKKISLNLRAEIADILPSQIFTKWDEMEKLINMRTYVVPQKKQTSATSAKMRHDSISVCGTCGTCGTFYATRAHVKKLLL